MTRRCGVLLHVSSLPSKHGLGDFGPQAHAFIDFLASAGQRVWQMLPLTAINAGAGNSPYSSYSAFAGNVLFISPELLVQDGILRPEDLKGMPVFPLKSVDFDLARSWRMHLLEQAFDSAYPGLREDATFIQFCRIEAFWLEDFCLFMALKREQQATPWYHWPREVRLRQPEALALARQRLGYEMLKESYFQYLFASHWKGLHGYAKSRNVDVFGDAPMYVSLDSCDVWVHRELFELDDEGLPIFCAGAPPDYFSETGQMWGNPVYDWVRQEQDGFSWWIERLGTEARRFDMLRLDHFRGFCAYWQVPACDPTAENGLWIPAPGRKLFTAIQKRRSHLRLVAEDLGVITPDITALMDEFGFPGMKILQFAFGGETGEHAYIPHNFLPHCVVYTGTHDNNTTRGWFTDELNTLSQARLSAYVGRKIVPETAAEALIRMALGSVAALCVIPMQDYLNLGSSARMNRPGVAGGNWSWRLDSDMCSEALASQVYAWAHMYGRI